MAKALAPAVSASARSAAQRLAALALMAASGFAALGYQIVWTQQSALWLGHEAAAVLAVVAAFFGGSALGALALGARIDRSAQPGRWYTACEAVIGLWALALLVLLQPASGLLLDITGAQPTPAWQWTVAFAGTFVLLLPATAAMGATLPALQRLALRWQREGTGVAALYASNTAGAVVGVLAAAFWLVPSLGLARTALACAAANLGCAAAAWRLFGQEAAAPPATASAASRPILLRLAMTGLLGIGYEVICVRVLSQVCENTVYTFALLLAVYLIGTSSGAAAYARASVAAGDAERSRDRLLRALALACVCGLVTLWGAQTLKYVAQQALGSVFGTGMAAALGAEAAVALAAFAPATFVMGMLFSQLAVQARTAGITFGRAIGANTLGGAFAPLLFGVVAIPAIGPKFALLAVALGYLALTARSGWRLPAPRLVGAAAALVAMATPPIAFVDLPPGGRVVSYREGSSAAVSVVADADGVLRLHIDNRAQEGSSATRLADSRQALLPLLLHPAPRRALFLGLGTGITAAAAAREATLQVDAVELLPEVIAASAHFVTPEPAGGEHPRPRVQAADARRYVRTAAKRYDLVVADNFHPARSGSGALYTVEHFRAVRARLADGGVFCQWLPLHQLDLDTLRSIVASFLEAFPHGGALLATNSLDTPVLGLVAREDDSRFALDAVRARVARSNFDLEAHGLADEWAVAGSFVAGPRGLQRFAAGAPLNTDDHPVVAYVAPRITYAADSRPRDRLLDFLQRLDADATDTVDSDDNVAASRLAAYRSARNQFLAAGRDVQPSADVRRMLAQVREPLLAVLRISPDFRPAREPLRRMAEALGQIDAAAARELLLELAQLGASPR